MISPPVKEEDIIGKWFGVVYRTEKFAPALYVAKALKRFLADENGIVECLQMECLLPKVGSGNILIATPKHLPPDIGMFSL